jgi:hypothetical protein
MEEIRKREGLRLVLEERIVELLYVAEQSILGLRAVFKFLASKDGCAIMLAVGAIVACVYFW